MKIKIRPGISVSMCNCVAVKRMEAISYLIPKLLSKMYYGCGMQLFEKMQCFYVVTVKAAITI